MATLRSLALIEGLEYPVALVHRNAGPAVDHVDHQLVAFAECMNRDGTSARRELDGI